MFDELSEKLQSTFGRLAGKGQLTEKDVDTAMREVKIALLEADVNFKVVRDFVKRVKEKAIGAEVLKSLTPAQVVVKIVHEELIDLLGEARAARPVGAATHCHHAGWLAGVWEDDDRRQTRQLVA